MNVTPLDLLIVDDSAGSRLLIERALRKSGNIGQCHHAASGAEALALLSRCPVHLIVTDLNMEGMDGRDLIRAVRARPAFASTPIAVLTSEDSDEVRAEIQRLGGTFYLMKPLTPQSVSDLLTRLQPPAA